MFHFEDRFPKELTLSAKRSGWWIFFCEVNAFPFPKMYWTRNNETLDSIDFYREITVSTNRRNWIPLTRMDIVFKNVTAKEFGKYICHAENSLGKNQSEYRIRGNMNI